MDKRYNVFIVSFLLAMALTPSFAIAQTISTIAGCGLGDDSLAAKCELAAPFEIALDTMGNAYITECLGSRVRKIDAAGVVSTFAGNGLFGYSGDGGLATAAMIGDVLGIATDRFGNVYIGDNGYHCIRKVNAAGVISTIAGTGVSGYSGDGGLATAAMLNIPSGIVADTIGNVIFADWQNNRVRKISASGIITTIVGTGAIGTTGNGGLATASTLGSPYKVTMDKKGNLYVAEVRFQCICKVDTAGILTIIAGCAGAYSLGADGDGGPATAASMTSPCGLAVDTSGNLYFSDIGNMRIRKVNMNTGIISNFAGNDTAGYAGDGGAATAAEISTSEGLACDRYGNLYIADDDNNRVRKVNSSGIISTYAGQNGLFAEGYAATNAEMYVPDNICTDAIGNIYIADYLNNRIRKVDAATGFITTVAGTGIAGDDNSFGGDGGPATDATINSPVAVAVDNSGNIFIADQQNQRIRKVNTLGIISTIAGNGNAGYNGNNFAATDAELDNPGGVTVDNSGNVYIADIGNNMIRKINTAGIIIDVAGNGVAGYSGDGGPASRAMLYYPDEMAIDGHGNIYISDAGNYCIRKVDTTGIITTFAGADTSGFSGDGGPATAALLGYPSGVKADSMGNVYIPDGLNERIRMVNTSGIISTVAGNGTAGFSGDGGPAISAMLNGPQGVAIANSGNLYIADGFNYRVRKVSLAYLAAPDINYTIGNVNVYPNPAHDVLNITATGINTGKITLQLQDITGRTLIEKTVGNTGQSFSNSMDIRQLAPGLYQLGLLAGEKKLFVKVVKE